MNFPRSSVMLLLAINVLVFFLASSLYIDFFKLFSLYYPENDHYHLWQVVTHLFMHGSLVHLLFNMYGLWAFGTPLEARWGTQRFLLFYFIAGLGAALVYTLVNYYQFTAIYDQLMALGLSAADIQYFFESSQIPQSVLNSISKEQLTEFYSIYNTPAVGASGAIYGILMAFAFTYPNAKLMLIFLPIPIPAKYFMPVIIALDLFFGMTKYSVGNIAHFAHVGGAFFGLLMMLWWRFRASKV